VYLPKPTKRVKTRKRIRRIGKQGKKWIEFRQQLITKLYDIASVRFDKKVILCPRCTRPIWMWIKDGKVYSPELHLHHKQRRSSHPELRYDETNILAICKECHNEIHS